MSSEISTEATDAGQSEAAGEARFAFLDQALWQQFRAAQSAETFTAAWLALLCRFIDGAAGGVVVLGEPDVGPFAPAAHWPEENALGAELSECAERAMAERQGVVREHGDAGRSMAYPIVIDERLYGVIAVHIVGDRAVARDVMRQLQWGVGWIEVLLRREQSSSDAEQRERTHLAFDMLATVLEHSTLEAACTALVTELAMRLGCDPVSVGFVRRRRCAVLAISHASGFGNRMTLIRDIGAAMDEALDQEAVVLFPPPAEGWDYRVTRAHAELAVAHKAGAILTVPLQVRGKFIGALTFEHLPGADFDEASVDLCDAVASIVGPVLAEKRSNDRLLITKIALSLWNQLVRLLGPHYFGRKLATVLFVALAAFFWVTTDNYTVTSPALLEGSIQRTVVAPFDGYLAAEHARAGEIVRAGQLLATLDDQDLVLERLRWSTSRRQRLTEYDRALANRERAEANIIQAQIEQADAQLALIDEQLERTRIKSPFDGVVVSGDHSQAVGAAIERGQELFKIAPLDAYRVLLEIDESDIADIQDGQVGVLRLTSIPETPQRYRIARITPIAAQAEGRNFFRVEATLDEVNTRMRPGMEGIAKTEVEERLLLRIWTDKLVDWLRLALWRWLP